jgi:disulfide bond formation protein DsbB
VNQPVEGVDARTDRVAQGAVGVALLAAFVYRIPWLVPVLSLLLAVGALAGPQANGLHVAFERWVSPRLPAPRSTSPEAKVPEPTVRAQDALAAVILAVASLAFLFGIAIVGWALALAEAVIAIIAATTRIHIGERLRRTL